MQSSQIDAPTSCDAVLRACFENQVGSPLVTHRLVLAGSGEETVLATAWQQQPLSDWPLSPPIQSVQTAAQGDGQPVVLGTGLAGQSHWSLAVSLSPSGGLFFDVACRLSSCAEFLGSTYQLGLRTGRSTYEHELGVGVETERCRLVFSPVCNADLTTQLSAGEDRVTLFPSQEHTYQGPCTVRWAYQVTVEPT